MTKPRDRKPIDEWNHDVIPPGESRDVKLAISESYSSMTVRIPIHIRRAEKEGPVVFVTAALHGDEINGTGAVRQLIQDPEFELLRGSVVLIPVLNLLAFDRHSRYLPDRRDLNRSFPGAQTGSLASRMARTIFTEIVSRCDYGIDLHTAAVRRTNYPNVRADLSNPAVRRIAEAFGCEVILNTKGPRGAFRREACLAGCPTIIMEGGEVWKVEPSIVESAVRGIKNVLRSLEMLSGDTESPDYQVIVEQTKWMRAERGGLLQSHAKPGEIVSKGQPLATNTTLLGREHSTVCSPFNAVVVGMTTLPAVS
ncbi:MAG: succinylglutamate desuccinylase/aspartoacylase family protein, partial [Planctomycetaceae bacterium]|nr:succinylglutamate desuccinylase/aspartoacylase family protein [Planctomycetaceae bacterium]